MAVPMRQSMRLGAYLLKQKLARRDKFPLLVELEPLFACNLACVGCGKTQYPAHILKQRMSVDQAIAGIEESGAPMVSIAGGEPLIHPEIHVITEETRELFRQAFAGGNHKRWRLNHSPLFLDFLEGKVDFSCTAWGIPSYSIFGWQRPCYLMSDGYARTYRELVETTDWSRYGRGRDPRCANCMAHCGYEPTAVLATMDSLKESLRAFAGG